MVLLQLDAHRCAPGSLNRNVRRFAVTHRRMQVAERKQTDYKVIASGHVYEYAYEIKIRNHKDKRFQKDNREIFCIVAEK